MKKSTNEKVKYLGIYPTNDSNESLNKAIFDGFDKKVKYIFRNKGNRKYEGKPLYFVACNCLYSYKVEKTERKEIISTYLICAFHDPSLQMSDLQRKVIKTWFGDFSEATTKERHDYLVREIEYMDKEAQKIGRELYQINVEGEERFCFLTEKEAENTAFCYDNFSYKYIANNILHFNCNIKESITLLKSGKLIMYLDKNQECDGLNVKAK